MADEICFEVPANVAEADYPHWIMEHVDNYRLALDLTGDYFDRRSQVDSLEIVQVEIQAERITVLYRIAYSGFRPCQDLHYSDVVDRRLTGKRNGRQFCFGSFSPLERRSTCDEL